MGDSRDSADEGSLKIAVKIEDSYIYENQSTIGL